jgi:hypothetical protein
MPSVAATLRQYPSHPAATTLKQTAYGSSLRPILSTEHTIIPRLSTPAHQRAPVSASFLPLHYESEAMQTPMQIRRHCMTVLSGRHGSSHIPVLHSGNTSISSSSTPRPALPRKIASGVFFVDPTCYKRRSAVHAHTPRSRDHTRGRSTRVRPASLERYESALRGATRPALQNRLVDARRPPPRRLHNRKRYRCRCGVPRR